MHSNNQIYTETDNTKFIFKIISSFVAYDKMYYISAQVLFITILSKYTFKGYTACHKNSISEKRVF